jgi:hypothetical protein
MSKKQLQQDIKKHGGFIFSDGTCNLLHLLTKAGDLIDAYNLKSRKTDYWTPRYKDFLKQFEPTEYAKDTRPGIMQELKNRKISLFVAQYHGLIQLIPEKDVEYSHYLLWNDFESFMQRIAPKGYYFGTSEGDGACFGWFRFQEEENEQ